MPYLLRSIRKGRWLPQSFPSYKEEAFQADCFGDLNTSGNILSLWELQDDFSNLDQVIVALASGRDYLANVDFAVIPHDSVSQCGVLKKTKGSSPYLAANEDWHFHLTEISISRLTKLAEAICASERKRIGQKRVEALLQRAFIDKLIDISVMKDSLRQKVVNAVR